MNSLLFSVDDVARTRFGVSPMSHLAFGAVRMQGHYVGASAARDRWWRQIRHLVPDRAAAFLELVNADWRGFPNAFIPITGSRRLSLGDELDAVVATTQDELAMEVKAISAWRPAHKDPDGPTVDRTLNNGTGSRRRLLRAITTTADLPDQGIADRLDVALDVAAEAPIPVPFQRLLDDDRRLHHVADGAWALYRACLAPDWHDIQRALQADIQRHARTMADHGTGAMLEQLHPHLRWREGGRLDYHQPAHLVCPGPVDPLPLRGCGFHIMPCAFLQEGLGWRRAPRQPVAVFTPSTPTINRPHRHHDNHPDGHRDSLSPILGDGRANVLRAIGRGVSTTLDIATTLGIAPSSVSAHTNTLRAAGLIVTLRHGNHVHHTLTTLGDDLLTTNQRP